MAYSNLKEIDAGIAKLRGLTKNVNKMVQELACAVVIHAFGTGEGQGSNDVSRATKLVKALPNSFRREYLIRWFENAGISIGSSDEGYPAKMVSKDSKRFRQPNERIDFANSNNWFDAVGEDGERAPWYRGPTPSMQEPNTMVSFSENIINFVDRTAKQVKEGKLRNSDAPLYNLNDDERQLVSHTLGLLRQVGVALNANATAEERQQEIAALIEKSRDTLGLINQAPEYGATVEGDENEGDNERTGTEG